MIFQHKPHKNVSSWLSIEFIQDRFICTTSESVKEFNERDITLNDIKMCDMQKDYFISEQFPSQVPIYSVDHTICVLTPISASISYIIDRSCYGLFNILIDNIDYIKKRFPGDSVFRETINYLNSKNKIDNEDTRLKELTKICKDCKKYVIHIFNTHHSKRDLLEVQKRIHCCSNNLISFMSKAIHVSISYINNKLKPYGLIYTYLSKEINSSFILNDTASLISNRKLMYYPQTVVYYNSKVTTLFYNKEKHILKYCAEKKNIECPFNHHDKARGYDRDCVLEIPENNEKIDLLAVEYNVSPDYKKYINTEVKEGQSEWIFSNKMRLITGNITERDYYKFNLINIVLGSSELFKHSCERIVKSIKINNLALGNLNG